MANEQDDPKPSPLNLEQLFQQATDLVSPPEEQVEGALAAAEAELVATHADSLALTDQLVLPEFKPPSIGLTITSEVTGNTYTIGRQIGEGAFGTVYEASDIWLNELAVKVLKPQGTYEGIRDAATQEFDKLLKLRHPNVTHVVDAFEFQHTFYIVTEKCFAPLSSLFQIGHLTGDLWVRPIARCLLQAVHFLHTYGYVHQDIHFGNVFMHFHRDELSAGGTPGNTVTFKLGDLGLTKLSTDIDGTNTLLNNSMLPPEFLDPIQFGALGHQVDIYHCGLMFLQLVYNKPLAFTREEILAGVPRQMAETMAEPFASALSKALRRRVALRTQSALDLWRDLSVTNAPLAQLVQGAQSGGT